MRESEFEEALLLLALGMWYRQVQMGPKCDQNYGVWMGARLT